MVVKGIGVLALAAWGALLLKYWLTNQLDLLINPNYTFLAVGAGFILLVLAGVKVWAPPLTDHRGIFPPGWSSLLLVLAAGVGLVTTPHVFTSQTALARGLGTPTLETRVRPQAFHLEIQSQQRTLVDWVRTLAVYPEPDAYDGQLANIKGFVAYPPQLPPGYLMLSRFVITCCAADAYPVGMPVRLAPDHPPYPKDSWLSVQGRMATEVIDGERRLVLHAHTTTPIPQPRNPYEY